MDQKPIACGELDVDIFYLFIGIPGIASYRKHSDVISHNLTYLYYCMYFIVLYPTGSQFNMNLYTVLLVI